MYKSHKIHRNAFRKNGYSSNDTLGVRLLSEVTAVNLSVIVGNI